jgi:uncharacterized membrane protein YedE/YeeE
MPVGPSERIDVAPDGISVTLRVFVDPGAAHPVAQLVLVAALFLIGGLMFSLTMALAFGCLGDGVRSTGPLR